MGLLTNPVNEDLELSELEKIVEDVAERLRNQVSPMFCIPKSDILCRVLTERSPDYDRQMNTALTEEGLVVCIPPIFANIDNPNTPGPFLSDVRIQINCCESRVDNHFRKTYMKLSEMVLQCIHHFTPPCNPSIVISSSKPTLVPLPDNELYICAVSFVTGIALQPFLKS